MTNYYNYILTNQNKTVLYTGFTDDLCRRILEHEEEAKKAHSKTFVGKYQCYHLVYYEIGQSPAQGIAREKQIKGWRREKKEALINAFNPEWRFLNDELLGR